MDTSNDPNRDLKTYISEMYRNLEVQQQGSINEQLLSQNCLTEHDKKSRDLMTTATSQSLLDEATPEFIPENSSLENTNTLFNLESSFLKSKKEGDVMDIVVAVKDTYPIKEVWAKKKKAWIATAMVVICDGHLNEIELTLWGVQCRYVFLLKTGHILHIQRARFHSFGEYMCLQMNRNSVLTIMGSFNDPSQEYSKHKDLRKRFNQGLSCRAYKYLTFKIETLATNEESSIKFCEFQELKPGNLVHVRAKINSFRVSDEDLTKDEPMELVVTLLGSERSCLFVLHGSTKLWRKKLIVLKKCIWEFMYLACASCSDDDSVELHTTVVSTANPLSEKDIAVVPDKLVVNNIKDCTVLTDGTCNPPSEIHLQGITIHSISCYLAWKLYMGTNETPGDAIERMLTAFLKHQRKDDYISIQCHFKNDPLKTDVFINVPLTGDKVEYFKKLLPQVFTSDIDGIICKILENKNLVFESETLILIDLIGPGRKGTNGEEVNAITST